MSHLEELRSIIVGEERQRLSDLKRRLESPEVRKRDVAEVLASAMKDADQSELADNLQDSVTRCLKRSIHAEPSTYANVLYPAMGPAIRAAVSNAIRNLLQAINQRLESALSVRGLKRRFESWRTGVPYAELVLRDALVYRVEQVFLIHRETGLAIRHVTNENQEARDGDAVSAMLTAIQDFVQDSFSEDADSRLTDVEVGDQRVWLLHGPLAMLACVIRGMPPAELREPLEQTLEDIHANYSLDLQNYGDSPVGLIGVEEYLDHCLQLELRGDDPADQVALWRRPGTLAVAALALGLFAYLSYNEHRKSSEIKHLLGVLRNTDGVLVTDVYHDAGNIRVFGLKDPYVEVARDIAPRLKLDPERLKFHMEPYLSLNAPILEGRARSLLRAPPDVVLKLQGDKVVLSGDAPLNWVEDLPEDIVIVETVRIIDIDELNVDPAEVRRRLGNAGMLPPATDVEIGHRSISVSGQLNNEQISSLQQYVAESRWLQELTMDNTAAERLRRLNDIGESVAELRVMFEKGVELTALGEQEFALLLELVSQAADIASELEQRLQVTLFGLTDELGGEGINMPLRRERALYIKSRLEQGLPNERLSRLELAISADDEHNKRHPPQRSVHVHLDPVEGGIRSGD